MKKEYLFLIVVLCLTLLVVRPPTRVSVIEQDTEKVCEPPMVSHSGTVSSGCRHICDGFVCTIPAGEDPEKIVEQDRKTLLEWKEKGIYPIK